jgi:hypothetical protein
MACLLIRTNILAKKKKKNRANISVKIFVIRCISFYRKPFNQLILHNYYDTKIIIASNVKVKYILQRWIQAVVDWK